MRVERVLETGLYVADLAAAEAFYTRVLGLTVHSRRAGRHVFFRCGEAMLLLFDPATTTHPPAGKLAHGAIGPGHVAFAIGEDEVVAWREQLDREGVAVEAEKDWPGGGHSIYFRDPAGNSLELVTPRLWRPG